MDPWTYINISPTGDKHITFHDNNYSQIQSKKYIKYDDRYVGGYALTLTMGRGGVMLVNHSYDTTFLKKF